MCQVLIIFVNIQIELLHAGAARVGVRHYWDGILVVSSLLFRNQIPMHIRAPETV